VIKETTINQAVAGQRFRLSAWTRDSGPDLTIFVHGLACSKRNFRRAWESGGLRHQSLLAFDLPGFGRSLRPRYFSHDLEEQAGIVAALIDQHASRNVHLVAHSLGGAIAVLIAPRCLARLRSLVLVEARLLRESCGLARRISELTFDAFARDFMPGFAASLPAGQRGAFDLEMLDPVALYRSACSLMDWVDGGDLTTRFAAAPCPRAFMYAETHRCRPELAALGRIERIERIFIPDAGHFVMEDNPAVFYERLRVFQQHSAGCA